MNILSIQNLNKSFGLKPLITDMSFGIEERDRVGVIGINGCGKSTLMKIMAGLEPLDEGRLDTRQGLRVEYLSQKPVFVPGVTVLEHIFSTTGTVAELVRDYELICGRVARHTGDTALMRRMDELGRRMEAEGAWEFETRARTVLTRLGIEDLEAPMETLSGGQRKRVALARMMLGEADLLLLDEPTNHLDADTIAWLEGWLQHYSGAVVLITHDRYFLDRVTNHIFEIDRGQLRFYDGNFAYYLQKKAEIEADFAVHEERRLNILRKEVAWLQRGARARATKQKAHIQRIEKMQEQSFDRSREGVRFDARTRRLGKKVIEIAGLSKSYGDLDLIKDFTYTFRPGECLGVLGPNGCGKSTLARLLTGRLEPDAGVIDVGETVVFGYYDQENEGLDPEERAIDYVKREGGEMLRTTDGSVLSAAAVMERFNFTPNMQWAPVGKLSGGEQRRLYLVRTLMLDPNFLILDEPTNDLDIETLQALEDFLDGFTGCLLVISHDRYFLDRTVDHVLVYEGEGLVRHYPGGYTAFTAEKNARQRNAEKERKDKLAQPARPAQEGRKPEVGSKAEKLSYKETRLLAQLEEDIPRMEERIQALHEAVMAVGGDYQKLHALSSEQAELTHKLEVAMDQWESLASRASAAGQM